MAFKVDIRVPVGLPVKAGLVPILGCQAGHHLAQAAVTFAEGFQ